MAKTAKQPSAHAARDLQTQLAGVVAQAEEAAPSPKEARANQAEATEATEAERQGGIKLTERVWRALNPRSYFAGDAANIAQKRKGKRSADVGKLRMLFRNGAPVHFDLSAQLTPDVLAEACNAVFADRDARNPDSEPTSYEFRFDLAQGAICQHFIPIAEPCEHSRRERLPNGKLHDVYPVGQFVVSSIVVKYEPHVVDGAAGKRPIVPVIDVVRSWFARKDFRPELAQARGFTIRGMQAERMKLDDAPTDVDRA